MDLKKEAARLAYSLVENHRSIGLGDGTSVQHLAAYLLTGIRGGLEVSLYTSSSTTERFLQDSGLTVNDIAQTDYLDQYFDGCDQVDEQLNVLKSGSGIHTREKLLASMAKHFIILADESKWVREFNPRFPLVLEVIPGAEKFVSKKILSLYPGSSTSIRKSTDNENIRLNTRNGNYLIECWFPEWPDLVFIQRQMRQITGVVEISLFYQMVNDAFVAGENGIYRYQRENEQVVLISKTPLQSE